MRLAREQYVPAGFIPQNRPADGFRSQLAGLRPAATYSIVDQYAAA
jgi:hypothetical protein